MWKGLLGLMLIWGAGTACERAVEMRAPSSDLSGGRVETGARALRSLAALPSDERGELIRLGYQVVTRTQDTVGAHVGNALNCGHCHLDGGRRMGAAPFVGMARLYPEYRSRNARVNTLEDRLDDCFRRSMNGTPLPAGSREKAALVAYIEWLSEGVTAEEARAWRGFTRLATTPIPDSSKGARIYDARCSGCHGVDGEGSSMAPPVWGPRSYNIGAGMARTSVAAAFIKHNMPLGQGRTLSDEEAIDLAAYINAQPRPDFPDKRFDWPQGGKPADAPY